MPKLAVLVNGRNREVEADPSTPLLWVLRDHLGLRGTKFGCGVAQCGACTVHLDGEAVRSCVTPLARAAGHRVTTIEGLSAEGHPLGHPVQRAWIEEQVPQCGYCQSGQIMAAAILLARIRKPTAEDVEDALSGNLCRCGTYARIRRAVLRAAEIQAEGQP